MSVPDARITDGPDITHRLDAACPWCGEDHDIGEIFDGIDARCANCGRPIVAVAFDDGVMRMFKVERLPWKLTGRAATRARWRRQGRR